MAKLCVGVVLLFLAMGVFAKWLAGIFESDFRLTYLAIMVAVSLLLSLALAVQRRRLRRTLLKKPKMSHAERPTLVAVSDSLRYALPTTASRSVGLTVVAGLMLVNGPLLPILIGPLFVLQTWFSVDPPMPHSPMPHSPMPHFLALGGGFAAAWLWWSISVPCWRRWAQAGGMSQAEVQYHGECGNLLWTKGHFLERTEWGRWRKAKGK